MYVLKFNNKTTRKKCEICSKLTVKTQNDASDAFPMPSLLTLNIYHTFCSVFIDFEQVNVSWVGSKSFSWCFPMSNKCYERINDGACFCEMNEQLQSCSYLECFSLNSQNSRWKKRLHSPTGAGQTWGGAWSSQDKKYVHVIDLLMNSMVSFFSHFSLIFRE